MKLGVTLASLRLNVREAIALASTIGLKGFEVEATRGEVTCELSRTGRRDFLHYSKSCRMEICALSGCFGQDFGREGGRATPDRGLEQFFEETKRLIDLAVDLRAPVVTTMVGRIPLVAGGREWDRIREGLNGLGRYAENFERTLATHIGETGPGELSKFITGLRTEGIRVAYDPSVMVTRGLDPVKGVRDLKGLIAHAYARDVTGGAGGFSETLPGEGAVPFKEYLIALYETGYTGYHVIKREAGGGRIEDVSRAKEFLERFII
ncbi:MAG TPA: sugar phosphate isomerase/epimerase family protein [Candidatus Tripitaka californicus]|uniref:sugar phosphate isomerase/epimerase family protein n=2 Tax=Candidatus Tripitaka californicus TaxID=3367616 RepID=UPI0040264285|nr:sugar phosphate isomerase/epimerase [Planctomycetota bacterium]